MLNFWSETLLWLYSRMFLGDIQYLEIKFHDIYNALSRFSKKKKMKISRQIDTGRAINATKVNNK